MAASQQQKLDYLFKKVGYSLSKTGIAEDGSETGTKKAPYEESIPSPLIIPGTIIWSQSQNIPTTPPTTDTPYVKAYAPGISSSFQMTSDNGVNSPTSFRTFVARQIPLDPTSPNVGDWIDTQFGSGYNIEVWKGNPASGGVKLPAAGGTSNDTWFFDYSSGVLNFNGTTVPSGVLANNIFIVGWRYIGAKGVLSEGGQTQTNLSVANLSVSGIATVGAGFTGVRIGSVTGIVTSTNPGVTTVTFVGNFVGTASSAGFAQTAFNLDSSASANIRVGFATTATNVINGIASVTALSVSGFSTVGVLTATSIGIGTTNPTSELFVVGNSRISGIVTIGAGNSAIVISAGIITSSGVGTVTYFGNLIGSASTASFATTAFNLDSSASANIRVGFATTATDVIGGIGSLTQLRVSGLSTVGVLTATRIGIGTTNATAELFVVGNSRISGIVTVGVGNSAVVISAGIITSSGVGTVTYFGDGSNLTGIKGVSVEAQVQITQPVFPTLASNSGVSSIGIATIGSTALSFNPSTGSLGIGTTNPTSKLFVNGNVFVSGIATIGTGISAISLNGTAGIITASGVGTVTYFGDGSKLTGIKGVTVEFQAQTAQTLFPTLAANSGVSSIGIATTGSTAFCYIPSSGNIGIGTIIPSSKLTVDGNVLVSGITTIGAGNTGVRIDGTTGIITSINPSTTVTFVGNLAGTATNVIGGIGSITQLSVSGVTTSSEFVGGGSDLRNLQGTHLVSYSSYSESSNSSTSIGGISTYIETAILSGTLSTNFEDEFGYSVATSADGKTIVIGARRDELSEDSLSSGVVYVFERNGNSFNQVGILTGTFTSTSDLFGSSVATSADGKTIIVGATSDGLPGVDGTGLVYVFDRIGNSFNQVGILTGFNAIDAGDNFGVRVATSSDGKTIVVGASLDETTGSNTGLVYVFDRTGNSFNQVGILNSGIFADASDLFGFSVATSSDGKTIVVGAPADDTAVIDTGLAYVFERNGNSFNRVGILTGSHSTVSEDQFGFSVAISADGKTIAVGAKDDEVPGANTATGVVYVYDRVINSFNQVGILTGTFSTQAGDRFGNYVAISADGKKIVVGAMDDEIPSPNSSGAVYVFNRVGNTFNRVASFRGSLAIDGGDHFGNAVAISADGKSIIAGAFEDSLVLGDINGIAYVFDEVKETYLHSNTQGNIGIGTSNPTSKLSVNGTVTATSFVGDGSGLTGISFPVGNFTQIGSGAVTRTISSKFNEIVSVKDFGATGIGTIGDNDRAAIQAAIDSARGVVYFPEGRYRVEGAGFTITKPIKIQGEGPASVIEYAGTGTLFTFQYGSGAMNPGADTTAPCAIDSIYLLKQGAESAECCIELQYTGGNSVVGGYDKLYITNVLIGANPKTTGEPVGVATTGDRNNCYWKKGLFLNNSAGVYATNFSIISSDNSYNYNPERQENTSGVHILNNRPVINGVAHSMINTYKAVNFYIGRFHKCLRIEGNTSFNGGIESVYLMQGEILGDYGIWAQKGDALQFNGIHFDTVTQAIYFEQSSVVRVTNCDIRSQRPDALAPGYSDAGPGYAKTNVNGTLVHINGGTWHTWTGNILISTWQTLGIFKISGQQISITGNVLEGSAGISKAAIFDDGIGNVFMSNNVTNNLSGTPPITDNTNDLGTVVWAPTWRRSADGRINVHGGRFQLTFNGFFKVSNNASFYLPVGQSISSTNEHQLLSDQNSTALRVYDTNGSFTDSVTTLCVDRSNSVNYSYLVAYSSHNTAPDAEFNLRGDGTGFCDVSWVGGGADYAEYFEWLDGNPTNEDRRGFCVVLVGNKIRQAVVGEEPIGVISGNPSMVGDSAWNKWNGKYLTDDYGSYIREDYEVTDEDGVVTTQKRRILNPNYDPNTTYVPRESRPEWDCVGLLGKLRIRNEQVINPKWILMQEISDSVKEYLVR